MFSRAELIILKTHGCVFDGTKTYGKCYEEYKSCKIYNDTIKDKTRAYCEAIKLLEPNQKCIYIYENDTCLVVNNYTTCEEYKGTALSESK